MTKKLSQGTHRTNPTGTLIIPVIDTTQPDDSANITTTLAELPVSSATQASLDAKAAAADLTAHATNVANPHNVTKAQVGLVNVPNVDATSRANHTGTQTASTISDFTTSVVGQLTPSNVYTPATVTVAPQGSGFKADYYTTGTSDETVFNSIINTYTGSGGARILAKKGTYNLGGSIIVKSNIVITGEGPGTVFVGGGTDNPVFGGNGALGTPVTDYEISNLKIDGTNMAFTASTYYNAKGIGITYSLRARIYNLYVYNTPGTGIGTDFLVDSTIDRCIVDTTGRAWTTGRVGCNGIGVGTGKYATESVIISNCVVKNVGNSGILFEQQTVSPSSRDMSINACLVNGCQNGIRVSGSRNVSISNCITASNLAAGVCIDTSPIQGSMNAQDVTVTSVQSHNNATHGINIDTGYSTDGGITNVKVSNCTVNNNASLGIRGVFFKNSSFIGNHIYLNGQDGIKLFTNSAPAPLLNMIVQGNVCHSNGTLSAGTYHGINISQASAGTLTNIQVSNNRCFDEQATKTQQYGISIQATNSASASGISVIGNNATGNLNSSFSLFPSQVMYCHGNYPYPTSSTSTATTGSILPPTYVYFVNATSAAATRTLPDATLCVGQPAFTVVKTDASANAVTVNTTSSQTINGSTTFSLSSQWSKLTVVTDGANWIAI